jgi:hypothetical protein
MIRFIFLALLLNLSKTSNAQLTPLPGPPRLTTKREREESQRNRNCSVRHKYSAAKRLTIYPFSKASKVLLVSFKKPTSIVMGGQVPLKNRKVDYVKLYEIKTLNNIQIDSLTQILYNIGYRGPFFTEIDIKCYNPRNAILFVDVSGKTFAYIELCFECMGHRVSSTRVNTGDFCEQKYELLENFFKESGIRFGAIEKEFDN